MSKRMLATVTGRDRPGIVEEVTQVLVRYGANLEESRMARLGGEFAGIMKFAVPERRASRLGADLRGLRKKGIEVVLRPIRGEALRRRAGYLPHQVEVIGADHEGIVHGVAASLAEMGVNIEELSTDVVPAPVTGAPLFSMRAVVEVPASLGTARLREQLDRLASLQGVDISVRLITG